MADDIKSTIPGNPDISKLPSLAEVSGVGQSEASRAIAMMNDRFNALAEDNRKLNALVVEQQSQLEKLNAGASSAKLGQIEIVHRHCNNCGTTVERGEKCPRCRPGTKINEIANGMKHNRPTRFIVRQV